MKFAFVSSSLDDIGDSFRDHRGDRHVQDFTAYVDAAHYLADLALYTPDVERQLACDIRRSRVHINDSPVATVAALHRQLADQCRMDVSLMCTQASVGAVVVTMQQSMFPYIIAELDCSEGAQRRLQKAMRVDVRTRSRGAVQCACVDVHKALRVVDAGDRGVRTICTFAIHIQFSTLEDRVVVTVTPLGSGHERRRCGRL